MTEKLQPKLRFPEFKEDWENTSLGKLMSFKNGVNATKEQYGTGYKFINVLDIVNNNTITHEKIIGSVNISEKEFDRNIVEYGDILFQRSSETREEVGQSNVYLDKVIPSTFGGFVIRGKKINDYDSLYIHYLLKTTKARIEITTKSGGSTRYNVGQETLSNVIISKSVDLVEQQKTADYLLSIDQKINLLTQKKTELSRYKKAMMQQLFSQQIRFKDENGNGFKDWEDIQLKDILEEHKEKNTGDKYGEVLSVAKMKGVINQIEHLGRSYSAKKITHYKVINAYDIVYTKSPTSGFPFGIIKQNKLNRSGVLSPLYAVFKPKTKYLGMILHDIFLSEVETYNYLVPLVQKGAKNTMNINNDDFLNGKKYCLPTSIDEQQKIADFLSAIDESINKVNEQITQTQAFKKAMLQRMFV